MLQELISGFKPIEKVPVGPVEPHRGASLGRWGLPRAGVPPQVLWVVTLWSLVVRLLPQQLAGVFMAPKLLHEGSYFGFQACICGRMLANVSFSAPRQQHRFNKPVERCLKPRRWLRGLSCASWPPHVDLNAPGSGSSPGPATLLSLLRAPPSRQRAGPPLPWCRSNSNRRGAGVCFDLVDH